MEELVSVIVPVYRAKPYIAKTIEMVRRQSFSRWELVLVDDCSDDGSVEEIERTLAQWEHHSLECTAENIRRMEVYEGQAGASVLLLCKRQNEGAARARNTGIAAARGRYIAFLDADDIWRTDKLEKELKFLQDRHAADAKAGFAFTAYEFGDEEGTPTGKVVHVPERLSYKEALSRTIIFTTTVLFDRKVIPDELMRMPDVPSEDTATWWRILRAGYTAYGLDEVLAVYRRPAGSLSANKFVAIKRIWNLYRRQEKLSVPSSAVHFVQWAFRAAARRI